MTTLSNHFKALSQQTAAYAYYIDAEAALIKELNRLYGKHAAIAVKHSYGPPGSNLRLLNENRDAAREQWETACFGMKTFLRTFATKDAISA